MQPVINTTNAIKAHGFEPKENSLVDSFKNRLDESVNKMLYAYYKGPDGDIPVSSSEERYARAGVVQHAVEHRYSVRCRLVRRAIDDIEICLKDEGFRSKWAGEYVFLRVARDTQSRLKKLTEGHGKQCGQDCSVRL